MTADELRREALVHRLLKPVGAGLWSVWSFVRSGIGGLYVFVGVASFFGYSELSQISKDIQELASDDANGSLSELLSAVDDPDADSATRASSRALSLHINGQKDAAFNKMHAILTVLDGLPNSDALRAKAWYGIGFIHHQDVGPAGDFIVSRDTESNRQALNAYNNVIKLDFDHVAAYVNRGIAYDALGQYADAERSYSMAIQLRPEEYRAYFNRGELYFRLSRHKNARVDLEKALSLARDAEDSALVTEAQRLLDNLALIP